jgi:histidinol phosphatase-like enzyme
MDNVIFKTDTAKDFLESILAFNKVEDSLIKESKYWLKLSSVKAVEDKATAKYKEISAIITDGVKRKELASELINKIADPVDQTFLRRKYIIGDRLVDIARDWKMSERGVHYIRTDAIEKFETIYNRYSDGG